MLLAPYETFKERGNKPMMVSRVRWDLGFMPVRNDLQLSEPNICGTAVHQVRLPHKA